MKSADFFDTETFPVLSFESTIFKKKAEGEYILTGDLTLKGHTKPIELNVEYGGTVTDGYGQVKAGFEITGKINRKDCLLYTSRCV